MSWLLLIYGLLHLWLIANVFWPRRNSIPGSLLSFALGFCTAEMGLHHIALHAGINLLLVVFGALAHPAGVVGLLANSVALLGLAVHYAGGARAKGETERALRQGLGIDYRDQIRNRFAVLFRRSIDWKKLLLLLPRRGTVRVKNISYARSAGRDLRLDIYHPSPRTSACPVLLHCHGGGYVFGSKNEQGLPLMHLLAEHGWVCVSINYRLSPKATFPDQLIDAKRALRWINQHIADYGGDPDFVVATGGSAGGHLCTMLALTANDPRYQPDFVELDTSIKACAPFYGIYDAADSQGLWPNQGLKELFRRWVFKGDVTSHPEAYHRASPIHQIKQPPPFFVVHGLADSLVPIKSAQQFVQALQQNSQQVVVYAEISGAHHAFDAFPSIRTQHVNNALERFFSWVHSRYLDDKQKKLNASQMANGS